MRIVFFAKGTRKLPSSRTRAYLIADYLKTEGKDATAYHVKTRPWWSLAPARFAEFARNIGILASLGNEDIVILQRTVHQVDFLFLILLRKWLFGRGYVFDFDDAIFLEKGSADLKAKLIIRNATIVFAGARFLEEYAKKLNPRTFLVTTSIDTTNIFHPGPERLPGAELIIGWTGTPVHYDNMKLLVEPLRRLVAEGHHLKLLLVGGGDQIPTLFKDIPGLMLEVIAKPPSDPFWTDPKNIAEQIRRFDIGVYPLQKTEWNKGKDTYKAKEFMGCGVPVVMSNWGENPLLVTHEKQGLLVDEDGWYDALRKLVTDTDYRRALAARGRRWVDEECSFRTWVPYMLETIAQHAKR